VQVDQAEISRFERLQSDPLLTTFLKIAGALRFDVELDPIRNREAATVGGPQSPTFSQTPLQRRDRWIPLAPAVAPRQAVLGALGDEAQAGHAASSSSKVEGANLARNRSRLVVQSIRRRERLALTQREVAERAGMDQGDVSRFERLKLDPRLTTLLRLAEALALELRLTESPNHGPNMKASDRPHAKTVPSRPSVSAIKGPSGMVIGVLEAVLTDDSPEGLMWGLMVTPDKSRRLVPMSGAEFLDDGVLVPFDEQHIRAAPCPSESHRLDVYERDALLEHYWGHQTRASSASRLRSNRGGR
jgi:transcriptional regulator with XRE-family HTH domain